jgi:triphosphoribosyl-dephospho-CoA synthase
MNRQAAIERAFHLACAEELVAPKPGNVGLHAGGHGMTAEDFRRSANVAASRVCAHSAPLGQRILTAVEATRAVVGQNTNLGIILLGAPLAMAAETAEGDLRAALVRVLGQADLADAEAVFRAIVLASPGGLGKAPQHDVREPAKVTLAVAMGEAARRDRIAWQWTHGFADVFGPGLATYAVARARWPDPRWAALAAYLRFLASFPDSHIARKFGLAEAERIRAEASPMQARLHAETDPERLLPDLLAWDAALKEREINPGTSADLTVATIFAHNLLKMLRAAGNDG